MTLFFRKFQRDVKAIWWLAGSLFLALSLVSYDPRDPSFNSFGDHHTIHNFCGIIGSFLADILFQTVGISAWLIVASLLWLLVSNFKGDVRLFNRVRFVWGLLLVITVSALLALYFKDRSFLHNRFAAGGILGSLVEGGLEKAFNKIGVSIILWATTAVLVVFYTEKPLHKLLPISMFSLYRFRRWLGYLAKEMNSNIQRFFAEWNEVLKAKYALKQAPATIEISNQAEPKYFSETKTEEAPSREPMQMRLPFTPVQKRKIEMKAKVTRKVENWMLPDVGVLEDPPESRIKISERELREKGNLLLEKLKQFSIHGSIVDIRPGPAVTMFEFKPNADVKISRIIDLADDISLALSSESVRIIAPIPGRDVVGIETSNSLRETVYFKELVASEEFWDNNTTLPIILGRQANGESSVVNLRKMPHLLVAGTTGSGKSVFLVSALVGLLYKHSPKTLKLILIDPKQVDLAAFSQIPHLLMPPIVTPKKAVTALKWAIKEMEKRYRTMSKFGARGLEGFNEIVSNFSTDEIKQHEEQNVKLKQDPSTALEDYYFTPLPYIVIVVEEFGDLMSVDKANVEHTVIRLAQMARACGIHLILAMQSPRRDVITGLIKTNIPGRISFKVASKMDSRIILDESGAERLLAQGDMLFLAPGVAKPERNHGALIQESEVEAVTRFWMKQGEPEFDAMAMRVLEGSGSEFQEMSLDGLSEEFGEDAVADEKYDEILAYVSGMKEVSASLLQRKFRLGYPRAARLIEIFEEQGVVGPANGSKPRQVLIDSYNNR